MKVFESSPGEILQVYFIIPLFKNQLYDIMKEKGSSYSIKCNSERMLVLKFPKKVAKKILFELKSKNFLIKLLSQKRTIIEGLFKEKRHHKKSQSFQLRKRSNIGIFSNNFFGPKALKINNFPTKKSTKKSIGDVQEAEEQQQEADSKPQQNIKRLLLDRRAAMSMNLSKLGLNVSPLLRKRKKITQKTNIPSLNFCGPQKITQATMDKIQAMDLLTSGSTSQRSWKVKNNKTQNSIFGEKRTKSFTNRPKSSIQKPLVVYQKPKGIHFATRSVSCSPQRSVRKRIHSKTPDILTQKMPRNIAIKIVKTERNATNSPSFFDGAGSSRYFRSTAKGFGNQRNFLERLIH